MKLEGRTCSPGVGGGSGGGGWRGWGGSGLGIPVVYDIGRADAYARGVTMPPAPPPDEPIPDEAWPGSGPPPPTWGADQPSATSDAWAAGPATGSGSVARPTEGPAGRPRYGARRALVGGVVVVVLAVVVGIVVYATRSDDKSTKVAATTTTVSARNLTPPSAAVAALRFQTFRNTDPAFTVQTPGPARREAAATGQFRFGPAVGANGRWTLTVRPAAPGADLKAELGTVVGSRGGTATPLADSGAPGPHLDELVTTGAAAEFVHVAGGTNNLFVLSVPRRSGGSIVSGRAIFNQMSGSLRAAGIGG